MHQLIKQFSETTSQFQFPRGLATSDATNEQRCNRQTCFFFGHRSARASPWSACLLTPTGVLAWNQCTCRRVHVTVAERCYGREHSRRAFPFSRWFTARTCLGRCRSHNGESCRRRSPADTVITGWHLPGRDHNDNGRFARKTSSYTPSNLATCTAYIGPFRLAEDHLCFDTREQSQFGLFHVLWPRQRLHRNEKAHMLCSSKVDFSELLGLNVLK